MEEQDNNFQEIPFQRGELLTKLNRVNNLSKFKFALKSISTKIDALEEDIRQFSNPRSPREDAIQVHDKKTLQVLKRQKLHYEENIIKLEEQIRQDIIHSQTE